jgi:hypothetical protein
MPTNLPPRPTPGPQWLYGALFVLGLIAVGMLAWASLPHWPDQHTAAKQEEVQPNTAPPVRSE